MNCIDREVAESDMTEGLSLSLISIIITSAPPQIIIIRSWRSGTPALGEGVTEGYEIGRAHV